MTLSVVMLGFNVWNWYLALRGYSTIEYWTSCMQEPCKDKQYHSFCFESTKDNLYVLFGTYKLLRILSPSLRNVPFTGLEWAYLMKELGFTQGGVKYLDDVEMRAVEEQESEGKQGVGTDFA